MNENTPSTTVQSRSGNKVGFTGVSIERHQRDDLTITLASKKAYCLENFMLAVTEFPVKG